MFVIHTIQYEFTSFFLKLNYILFPSEERLKPRRAQRYENGIELKLPNGFFSESRKLICGVK